MTNLPSKVSIDQELLIDIERLKIANTDMRNEIQYHRDMMNKMFQWTTTTYVAIIGGIIAIGPEKWNAWGDSSKYFLTFAIVIILVFFIRQTIQSTKSMNSNAQVIVKVGKAAKFFEESYYLKGDRIYKKKWEEWGKDQRPAGKYHNENMVIIIIISFLILVFIWIR